MEFRTRSLFTGIVAALLAALLGGCQDAQITSYQVPRERVEEKLRAAREVRLRAVMVPHKDNVWFFKLVGPSDELGEHLEAFDQFIQSIRFPERGEEITWTVPKSWRQGPPKPLRYRTFLLGKEETPLELTVFVFGRQQETGNILSNVNRWRRNDLGLKPITEEELKQVAKEIKIEGLTATQVDMTGPGGSGGPPMMK